MGKLRYAMGIDLGGTKVEACLMDHQRKLVARKRIPSEPRLGLDRAVDNILKVAAMTAEGRPYEAVGMGTPGTYLPETDTLFGSPHTPTYELPGFIGKLIEKLGKPLAVENDANCLALAEFYGQCVGKFTHVMAVILGTGVGSGFVLDNRLYRGKRGGAGEIGHLCIDINGRSCECGKKGCIEAYLSGPSLSRRFQEQSGETLPTAAIYEKFKAGDLHARKLFDESCRIMGEAFGSTANLLDLDAIILGGGVSNIPLWYTGVPPHLQKALFGLPRNIPILPPMLGDSAGVVGAAYLALKEMGEMDF